MVLLFNCFITNQSSTSGYHEYLASIGKVGTSPDRGNLEKNNKIDVLKYCLSSISKFYPWKTAIIKIQLDTEYSSKETHKELEEFVNKEFEGINLFFSNKRNVTQQDWIDTYNLIDSDFIYLCGNHDHIILNESSNYFKDIIDSVKRTYKNEYITIIFSHWPEFIRAAKCGMIDHYDIDPISFHEEYKLEDNYISYNDYGFDSMNIISKNLYEDWFLKGNWDDALNLYPPDTFKSNHIELPRIEGIGITDLNFIRNRVLNIPTPIQKIILPYKEMARHYDGYFYQGITNNEVPALSIPTGFFENDIKIRYGYDNRKEGWININPKSEYYYAYNKSGADYKFTLKEIPLFWKNKISEIDINPDINEEEMLQYRLKTILETIYTSAHIYPYKYNSYIDDELKNKILNEYLKLYPEYKLI